MSLRWASLMFTDIIFPAVLCACACAGMKPEHHVGAIKSAVAAVEAVRRLFPERKLPELVGAENLNALAKAIVTIRVSRKGLGWCG